MSIVKSFSVGNGDMFYINHGSDNFTVIDCCLDEENSQNIISEILKGSKNKGIFRFISTHPDDDHIKGLQQFDNKIGIRNFYCVENNATKDNETDDFKRYCELRDDPKKHFYISKDCSRKWMNIGDDKRGCAGINILWPDISNADYNDALKNAKNGGIPNNICPIIKYSLKNGVKVLWMGDMETGFLKKIKDYVDFSQIDILFAPHHGRKSGKVPSDVLEKLSPKIIVVGEAPSKDLEYYSDYTTITQNTAGDITFECMKKKVRVYVENENYPRELSNKEKSFNAKLGHYIGTIDLMENS